MIGDLSVLVLFAFIMTGVYGGLFSPIEAAGMGAAAALVSPSRGRAGPRGPVRGLVYTAVATAMIFAIIGAGIFSNLVTMAGPTQGLSDLVADLGLGPWTVMPCIVTIYLLLRCVPESSSMILLMVPVFFPVVSGMDFGVAALATIFGGSFPSGSSTWRGWR